ncbi:MAG: IclR family transcriptional regulator [Candidatus Dormibacteria bacterium]
MERDPAIRYRSGNQTSIHALRLLQAVGTSSASMNLSGAREVLGISKSAAHRLLASLVLVGFLEKAADQTYYFGPTAIQLAATIYGRDVPARKLHNLLESAASLSQETCSLHVRTGTTRTCIDVVIGPHPISRVVDIGHTVPLGTGATGRALLSLEKEVPVTDASTEPQFQISQRSQPGYYIGMGETIPDLTAISVPIQWRSQTGLTNGAVTVAGPSTRMTADRALELAPRLVATLRDMLP